MSFNGCIRRMITADLPAALRLSQQNGWNQLEADWRRFLTMQRDGCFAAEVDGTLVGTACGCIFGSVAWVALVLVDTAQRNRGLGTALTRHVLDFLDAHRVPSVRLDATPLGRPIYEKLGFVAEYELARHAGVLPVSSAPKGVEAAVAADLDEIHRLDQHITRTDRRKFLERLFAEAPDALRVVRGDGRLRGYAASRPGARAVQVGPCLADAAAGPLLLADAFHRHAGQNIFIDIPLSHAAALALAQEQGLTVQRHLLRMGRGRPVSEQIDHLWASAGPEKG
jgi:ribosomal protein S18 acetylase RimI-like enzyme